MYGCGTFVEPGRLPEPYHIPGYGGHVPSMRDRNGGTFGRLTRDALEDPCVAQGPIPILMPPPKSCSSCPPSISMSPFGDMGCQSDGYYRNPIGCDDMGCNSPAFCQQPPQRPKTILRPQPIQPCLTECCDPRAHHLNRSPYMCANKPETDAEIYRCCEAMGSTYAGHVPGFTFHSNGRTFGNATWGTKKYMQNCFYYNTFTK